MEVRVTDNSQEVLSQFDRATIKALTEIGLMAEGYAKEAITSAGAVDTGRLRNSITFAISGQPANISTYTGDKGEEGVPYTGTVPNDDKYAVFIGSNLHYAEGIETGQHRKKGAVHFLRNAATQHTDEYKKIVELELK